MKRFTSIAILIAFSLCLQLAYSKKTMDWQDIMNFKNISQFKASDDGNWVSYILKPDRGDGSAYFRSTNDTAQTYIIERGTAVKFTNNAEFAAATVIPKEMETENAKSPADAPKNSLGVINLDGGKVSNYDEVKNFEFSVDSKWLAIHHFPPKDEKKNDLKDKITGSRLSLLHLNSGTVISIDYVNEFVFDTLSRYFFYTVSDLDSKKDGLYYRALVEEWAPERSIVSAEKQHFSNIAWNHNRGLLAFMRSNIDSKGNPQKTSLWLWDENNKNLQRKLIDTNDIQEGLYLPVKNEVQWNKTGDLLYFGFKPLTEKDTSKPEFKYTEENFLVEDSILTKAETFVWHWDDDYISTHQIKWWTQNKARVFRGVFNLDRNSSYMLADSTLETVIVSDNNNYTIGYDNRKYRKEVTWGIQYFDLYLINLLNNSRRLVAERIYESAHLSPGGEFLTYFDGKNWILYRTSNGNTYNLTEKLNVAFFDVDNDVPAPPRSYGLAGWIAGDSAVMVYDKYDLWRFNTHNPETFVCVTALDGRFNDITCRIVNTDKDRVYYQPRERVFMHLFHHKEKWQRVAWQELHVPGPWLIGENDSRRTLLAKTKDADKWFYSESRYDKFPDLYMAVDIDFNAVRRLTNYNAQLEPYNWGKAELVDWVTQNNDTLQGYVIKPDNFDPKKKYPLLVYFYEQFSDNYHNFWVPRVWHLPCFQQYSGDGYVIFFPDINYRMGQPGFSAGESIISGVESLAKQGFIDEEKIGITGHSWAAYQLAHIISQTDKFSAASAGAPVGNMTSAYSQIRLGSGLARQFQYEMTQSRIGGNLWDSLDNYINNSPVFRAPLINTPLLILHGDVDDAVPWEQAIELYLALRRLEKEVFFVQYKNEPHHPRKYHNKLDWARRTKEFFDHYLLGKPAPKWIEEGEPWWGN
jgi:dipeptidyl aminopeptidase/acylaminoacyl peptidase